MLAFAFALACAGADGAADTASTGGADGGTQDGGADGGSPTEQGSIPALRAEGEVTWTLSFDETALALGFWDCSYRRTWSGLQVLDMDYLCPDCAVQLHGDATVEEGLDCYAQIVNDPPQVRAEAWGWSEDGRFFRSGYDQLPLAELTTLDTAADDGAALAWQSESELTDGGTMLLSASGSLSWWLDEQTLLPDPWPVRTEPYTCGWPTEDPGTLALDYDLALGSIFPNVRLVDQCDERLALWDLHGRWLVLDSAQPDCGPCRSMASTAEAFVLELAGEGIEVVVVNLLGKGLAEPFEEPDDETYAAWVDSYQPTGPVLRDRGFAYALFPDFAEEATGESFGYPTWVVVAPDMTIAAVNIGFSDWEAVAAVIRAGEGG